MRSRLALASLWEMSCTVDDQVSWRSLADGADPTGLDTGRAAESLRPVDSSESAAPAELLEPPPLRASALRLLAARCWSNSSFFATSLHTGCCGRFWLGSSAATSTLSPSPSCGLRDLDMPGPEATCCSQKRLRSILAKMSFLRWGPVRPPPAAPVKSTR